MSSFFIDPDRVRWSVGGEVATREEAVTALTTKPLLVLMHGFGSFEGDLIGLAPNLPHEFVCASPRAPFVAPEPIVDGFSWFPQHVKLQEYTPSDEQEHPAVSAATGVVDWLEALSHEVRQLRDSSTGPEPDIAAAAIPRIALMGFSQGGVMVTSLMRLLPSRFLAGVNCSGFTAPGEFANDGELAKVAPPLFWGHDIADPIISREAVEQTAKFVEQHTTLTHNLYPGIAHSISREELSDIAEFLTKHLAATPS